MEGTEENNNQEGQEVITNEPGQGNPGESNGQPNEGVDKASIAFEYLKENGIEVNSIDDLKKDPEKIIEEKIIDKYEGISFDEDDQAYFQFKKETGRSRKDFEALNVDFDKLDPLSIAREQAKREIGVSEVKNELLDQYIAEKLGVDLDELSEYDKIKLHGYGKPYKDEKKAEQEKYRQPLQNTQQPQANPAEKPEFVKLPNGAFMKKAEWDALEGNRLKEVENAKEAVKAVTSASFKVSVDDNGSVHDVEHPYVYSEQDMQNMVSIVTDIDGTINQRYSTETGFNHKQFAEDMLWSDPKFRGKAIADLITAAVASNTEEVMKRVGNHNFTPNQGLPKQLQEGVEVRPAKDVFGQKN